MAIPTWNGQPVNPEDARGVAKEAFDHLHMTLRGLSVEPTTEAELLHLIEAVSHVEDAVEKLRRAAIPAARAAGISLAKLGAAMGVTRATAQYHYEKATLRLAEEWAHANGTTDADPS